MRYEITRGADVVELWSERRLPFEPAGDVLRIRDELREALRALPSSPALTAEYSSNALGLCDIENVLHYNVGPASMAHLCAAHLSLERLFSAPRPSPANGAFRHHARYRRGAHERVAWVDGAPLAERRFVFPADTPLDVANIWFHARNAAPLSDASAAPPRLLTVVIDIRVPSGRRMHAGASLKVIVDGIVSSLHRHDGETLEEVVRRLTPRIAAAPRASDVTRLLRDGAAELGPRHLLFTRANGVQWNPADDGITALFARVGSSSNGDVEIDARVFEAIARA